MIALMLMAASVAETAPAAWPPAEIRYDRGGRPVIGTYIDDRGPFPMVIDTAAQSSLIVPNLVDELALKSDGQIAVAGITGGAQVAVFPVKHFASAVFDLRDTALIALPNPFATQARGIIGMDVFASRKLVLDRKKTTVRADSSGPPEPGYVAVAGHRASNGLLSVPVRVNGVTFQALIDSGASQTVLSPAVLAALGWTADDARLKDGGEMRGATQTVNKVRVATIDSVSIGPVTLRNVEVIVPQVSDEDAVTLGSDVLNVLDGYALDGPRETFEILIPPRK